MKYKGSKSQYTTQRDRELYHAYLQCLNECDHINIREICRIVVLRPCSQFWISEERASWLIRQLENGNPIDVVAKGKTCYHSREDSEVYRSMIAELYRVYCELKEQNPKSSSIELICLAVNSPAPQFYLTPETARKCIYRYRRCQEILNRLKHHASFVTKRK